MYSAAVCVVEKRGDEYGTRLPPWGTHVMEGSQRLDAAYLVYARPGFAVFPASGHPTDVMGADRRRRSSGRIRPRSPRVDDGLRQGSQSAAWWPMATMGHPPPSSHPASGSRLIQIQMFSPGAASNIVAQR